MEFDRGRRHPALQFFDVGGDVDRLDLAQVGDATRLAQAANRAEARA